jgi:hypothetical protein
MKLTATFEEALQTAGITLVVAWVASVATLSLSPTDSGQREFGHAAVDAVCWLYVLWTIVSIPTFALRRNGMHKRFKLVFAINIAVMGLITIGVITKG